MKASNKHLPEFQIGQPFNPFRRFKGIYIPEALVRSKEISAGAKLIYGRLARYAGRSGNCYPAVATLAEEVGLGARQAQKYLLLLERKGLIRRVSRFDQGAQTTNYFEFLWHDLFDKGVNDSSGARVNDCSAKESQSEESHLKKEDLDCLLTNRTSNHPLSELTVLPSQCEQYPKLREALAEYMKDGPDDDWICPTNRRVIEVMNAAYGASEDEVVQCLKYLREERGLKPGTRLGPRTFAWFPTVIREHFERQRRQVEGANPMSGCQVQSAELSDEQFRTMTQAFTSV